ncbi:hypothetical protein PQ465_18830 [Sphingobacterium oryzagri]|uniref:Fimbrillin family protein n=1 Tax=Sphingobacterium oryzagri TaxID=3025669 RepID=A0ABY7WIC0_9SPHI|nr:hypothetical protein [Sphingobacterium sp. KACC 22765]WDF68334.1 hypothetical protein PQ465_18830 [Sphingobacterium sp. KACC 22765]
MKVIIPRLNTIKTSLSLAFACSILFFSCSKEQVDQEIAPEDLVQLTVNITGVDEENIEEGGSVSDNASSKNALKATVSRAVDIAQQPQELSFEGFDALTSVENDGYKSDMTRFRSSGRSTAGGNKMVTAMPNGIRYRILLYRSNGVFWDSQEATAGTALNINVARGETYTWYAYSYNDNQSVANVSNTSTPTVPTGTTRDLITASGTVSITATGSTHLPITFSHRTNRIGIELNTLGMFANLNSATVTLTGTNFTTGTLDLRTNVISGATSYTPAAISTPNFVRPAGYTFNDRNVAYYYTASNAAMPAMQVSLSNFGITLTDNTTRTFPGSTSYTFNVPSFSSLGRSKTALINLVESPVTVAGIQWARENLYYISGDHNAYRFYPNNNNIAERRGYWPWRALTPDDASIGSGDPCRQVYPTNRWRTPSPAELITLSNTTSGRTFVQGTGNGSTGQTGITLGRIEYTGTGTGSPTYPNSNLVLPYNGHSPNISLLTGLATVSFGIEDYARDTYIWSDDPTIALGSILNVLASYYRAGQVPSTQITVIPPSISIVYTSGSTTGIGDVTLLNLLGLNIASSGFRNVRCVRTTAANP